MLTMGLERRRLLEELQRTRNSLNAMPGALRQSEAQPDTTLHFPYASNSLLDLLGITPAQAERAPQRLLDALTVESRDHLRAVVANADQAQPDRWLAVLTPRRQPKRRLELVARRSLPDKTWHGVLTDVSRREQLQMDLRLQAETDALTTLPNRTALMSLLRQRLQGRQRFAVLFMDCDRFKQVNDSLGHDAGDKLLRLMARRLRHGLRPADDLLTLAPAANLSAPMHVAARLGGDEFVVVADDLADAEALAAMADRLVQLMARPYRVQGMELVASVSVGVVLAQPGDTAEQVLRNADTAMYEAKRRNRGHWVLFEPDMHARAVAALTMESDLRSGLRAQQLRAVFQPIIEISSGRVVGILSERDLFALQRLSLKQVSTAIRAAADVQTLAAVAQDIRRFARNLLGQGVGARQLTELISHLNDVLTERLVGLVARARGLDLTQACWLAFGSEGRSEQTISTDQDNGLVFTSTQAEVDRPTWLAFAEEVNQALDHCGYPLCKGNIMASNPDCCLTQGEWLARFADWIEHGAPEDLLKASIYFDFRPLVGAASLTTPLRELVLQHAGRNPRFMKQMAENALRNSPALNWRGAIDAQAQGNQEVLDLKLHGTAIYVEAARLYALAHGVAATGTRARFEAAAQAMGAAPQEAEAWVGGFEYLQMLRLQVQLARDRREAVDASDGNPNLIDVAALNDIDRRVLNESLRVARRLQQRIQLDYVR